MALLNKAFGDIITLSRSSGGGRFNAQGQYEWLAANQPRIDYDPVTLQPRGLLIEEQRTNLLASSSNFTVGGWSLPASKTLASGIAPDGSASTIITNTGATVSYLYIPSFTPSYPAGTKFCFSCFLKSSDIGQLSPAGVSQGTYDLSSRKVVNCGGGWYRHSGVFTTNAENGKVSPQIILNAGEAKEFWGFQVEVGTFPTCYIPTAPSFTSRASTATYRDSAGVLQVAGINVARYGYTYVNGQWVSRGLILEPQATNFVTNSYFSLGADGATPTDWMQRGTVTGLKTADASAFGGAVMRVIGSTSAGVGSTDDVRVGVSGLTVGSTYTVSVRIKPISGAGYVVFAGTTKSLPATGGWQTYTFQAQASGTSHSVFFGGSAQFDIDWLQVESGSNSTSYIPTTTAQVTRAGDVSTSAQVTRAADDPSVTLSPWYRADEGTLFVEGEFISPNALTTNQIILELNDNTGNNRLRLFRSSSTGALALLSTAAGVQDVSISPSGVVANQGAVFKAAIAMKNNDFAFSAFGQVASVDNSGAVPQVTKMQIGVGQTGVATQANLYIRSIRYYPCRLTNAELHALTA